MVLLLAAVGHGQTLPAGGTAGAAGAGPAVLEGLPIVRVEVEGNTRTTNQLILDQVRSQPGQVYSRALVDVDNKAVAALDRFVTTEVRVVAVENPATHAFTGVEVRFVVVEKPLVTAVEIAGNRKFQDTQIREGLVTRAGSAVDPFRIDTDRKFILDMYKKKGYSQVSVDVDQELLAKQGIVRYQVIEGPESHIQKIVYEGNTALKDSYINWRIQTKTYFWIFPEGDAG